MVPTRIEELEAKLLVARAEIAERQNTINAQGGQIAALEAARAKDVKEIAETKRDLENWKHCHGIAADMLVARDKEIAELREHRG